MRMLTWNCCQGTVERSLQLLDLYGADITILQECRRPVEDLAMVCANCHRMLHRGEKWLTVSELAALVSAARQAD